MRLALIACLLLPGAALAGKKPKKGAPPAPPPAAAPAPEPEPEPEPEIDDTPPAPINNISVGLEITRMDGTVFTGRAVRVERGVDWYAEDGWTTSAGDIKVALESDRDMKDVAWTDIAQIDVTYGGRGDIDCMYDSNFVPWMYMCTLRSAPVAKLKDGSTWRVTSRHQWRFTTDDDRDVSFYLFRLPARQQDEQAADLDTQENYTLYGSLQAAVLARAKADAIKKIVVKP
jgi:hypothetical protein